MKSQIDPAYLTWARFLCHLECREGLDIAVCLKRHSVSTVIVNLNLVSKVKGGKVQ